MFEVQDIPRRSALMRVIGVGGAGGNAVNRMIDESLEGVEFISANTDAQALAHSRAPVSIQLGKKLTRGLGAGARPGIGRQAVAEDAAEVRRALEGADLVFIAAGMGGGTGTGAAPVIGEMAREMGALTVAVVSRPFSFEGKKRMQQAEQGLAELRRSVDTMVVVPNDRLRAVVEKGTSFQDALRKADEILLHATQGISDLIRVSGEVNVDFADVRTVMTSCGAALMGTGVGRGDDRALRAAQDAVTSPLLDNLSIRGAKGVLINITGGSDLAIDEVTDISTLIQREVGDEAEIIFGTVQDPEMEGVIRVTLIATGFDEPEEEEAQVSEQVIRPTFGQARDEVRPVAAQVAVAGGSPSSVASVQGTLAVPAQAPVDADGPVRPVGIRPPPRRPAVVAEGPRVPQQSAAPTRPGGEIRRNAARGEGGGMFRFREVELPTFVRRVDA